MLLLIIIFPSEIISSFDDDFTFQPAKLTESDPQLVLSIDQMNFASFSFTTTDSITNRVQPWLSEPRLFVSVWGAICVKIKFVMVC